MFRSFEHGQVYRDQEMRAADALAQAGIAPIELQPKEGLALVNGTTVMTSLAGLALFDTAYLGRLCVAAVAMSVEALKATTGAFRGYHSESQEPSRSGGSRSNAPALHRREYSDHQPGGYATRYSPTAP